MDKQAIGVVGYGFVGQAVAAGFCPVANVMVYDKDPEKGLLMVKECVEGWAESKVDTTLDPFRCLIRHARIIFVCVPTPMRKDGSCDTSVVEDVVQKLDHASVSCSISPTIVIKSTVPPGTTAKLQEKCQWVNLVFNPEFLTEANSMRDFAEQDRVVLGGVGSKVGNGVEEVDVLYREFGLNRNARIRKADSPHVWPLLVIQTCTSTEAEMIKYLVNCFLATKVSLANEFSQLCEKVDADWDKVWRLASKDERLGTSHWQVPGPDGKLGFGGSCFPKDLFGMVKFMVENSVDPHTLLGAWDTNIKVRPERDWEDLKGRAVQ